MLIQLNEPKVYEPNGIKLTPIPVMMLQIPLYDIGQLIGKKGNNINMLKERTGAAIDVNSDGQVIVSGGDRKTVNFAVSTIKMFMEGPECGKIYRGRIRRDTGLGFIVELAPGTDGILIQSRMARKESPIAQRSFNEGDDILVKVIEVREMPRSRSPMILVSSDISEEEFNSFGE